jgi:MFS transporter, SP family, general alpha glucoside:H+ symporter
MAGTGNSQEVKEVVDEGFMSEESSIDETKQSTWQMIIQYKTAVLWSAFMGLAAINWGMDVLVSTVHFDR